MQLDKIYFRFDISGLEMQRTWLILEAMLIYKQTKKLKG